MKVTQPFCRNLKQIKLDPIRNCLIKTPCLVDWACSVCNVPVL